MEAYKARFLAEYLELEDRRLKLAHMLDHWDSLGFEPTCPRELLERQLSAMDEYAGVLRERASLEGVELPDVQ